MQPAMYRAHEAGFSGWGFDRMEAVDNLGFVMARASRHVTDAVEIDPIFTELPPDALIIEEIPHEHKGKAHAR